MTPWELLGRTSTAAGDELTLMRRARELVIFANGKTLMSSRMHGSEEALATFGCRTAAAMAHPTVLVGGLGMGFTLRATLDALPSSATVVVAELLPAIVEWNRGPLGDLAGHPLDDPRVEVVLGRRRVRRSKVPANSSTPCCSTSTTGLPRSRLHRTARSMTTPAWLR